MRMACRHRISARPIFDQLSSVPWSGSQELGKGLTFFLELREKKKRKFRQHRNLKTHFPRAIIGGTRMRYEPARKASLAHSQCVPEALSRQVVQTLEHTALDASSAARHG